MKKIKIIKPFKIRFVNENDDTTAEIVNPPANFVVPRVGELFELSKTTRANIVTSVYHNFPESEVIIWYDFHLCYENKQIEKKDIDEGKRIPKEKF
jgi:hypothetical protein